MKICIQILLQYIIQKGKYKENKWEEFDIWKLSNTASVR